MNCTVPPAVSEAMTLALNEICEPTVTVPGTDMTVAVEMSDAVACDTLIERACAAEPLRPSDPL